MNRTFLSLAAGALLLVAVGCESSKKVTAHNYQIRGESDRKFVETVLALEKTQHGVDSKVEISKDDVATVTTSEAAHLKLRRELNVRVSDQWPYNWRSDDF